MYGTTIKSFNENKEIHTKKAKKERTFFHTGNSKKEAKKLRKKDYDTKYMKIGVNDIEENADDRVTKEAFSIKDLPIASVVVTLLLTMMLLVMTSGFGGL